MNQSEATSLIAMDKILNEINVTLPQIGDKKSYKVASVNGRHQFVLDFHRFGRYSVSCTLQERYQNTEILVRLDIGDSKRHKNPNGTIITGSHIHIYRENYNDKWAFSAGEIASGLSLDLNNALAVFSGFCDYCHISIPRIIQGRI
jgi:hypothetical protein